MKYEIGDKVKVKKIGLYETNYETETIGKITHIEEHDKLYPYKVDNKIWCMEKEVELVEPIYTNKEDLYKRIFDLENERKDVNDMYMREIKCLKELEPIIIDEDKEKIKKMLLLLDKSIDLKNVTASIDKYTSHYLIKLYSKESNSAGNSEASINVYHSYIGKMKDNHRYTLEELGIEVE